MRISIAMATYNGAKYLQEQLDSFLYQTRLPDELVVCDDGSTDATLDILEDFRQQAPFAVRVYRNEVNLGYIKNFEKALSLCTGDIIYLSDQDDVWLCKKIEQIERIFLSDSSAMVVVNDQFVTDADLSLSDRTALENVKSAGVAESWFVAGCCTTIKNSLNKIILPIPLEAHGHDAWINKLAEALSVRRVHSVPLQYYRRHGENNSKSFASNLGKVSFLDLLRQYGLRDASDGWKTDVIHHERYLKRINDRRQELNDIGLAGKSILAVDGLTKNIESLRERINIFSGNRVQRSLKVLGFWMRGGYDSFSGWRSAVKDIVRP